MKHSQVEQLPGRDLDAAVAREVCGICIHEWNKRIIPDCVRCGVFFMDHAHEPTVPDSYSTSLDACRTAELEIERRGLLEIYADKLRYAVWCTSDSDNEVRGLLILADAETRCRAMLETVREGKL